ncbi:MAG: DUF131 domain-containing protein [Vulcanisaeta sp.]|jgi:uncharacterized protein (TIGR00304 family)|nr:MAG: hypothetical protein AT718_05695 [Vulcanisaeta sp. JCHS_4]MCG2864571.1 DUF131 domain-containing protein [Vulcanisaeta sp.]MCG2866059.1 DUF131 domain-containing protein [Vulcanisaeta sp.]MCG2885392.1 DUF131 domain-containing protein [Vulcanisaeta sp.]PVU72582.1 hypothetical protein DDW08_01395 [Vulcanisaeta sp. SCGC AB-777_J10]
MDVASIISLAIVLSIILAFLGIILIMIDVARGSRSKEKRDGQEGEEKKAEVGGVVLIGPVPIIFGNDPSVIKWAVILTIIIVVLFVILALLPGIP